MISKRKLIFFIALGTLLWFIAIGLPIGVALWNINASVKHSCQALEFITSNPPKHQTLVQHKFYEAILYWQNADGCT